MKGAIFTIGTKLPTPCDKCVDEGIPSSEGTINCQYCEGAFCADHAWGDEGICDRCANRCSGCGHSTPEEYGGYCPRCS